jgi:hypothetical protein
MKSWYAENTKDRTWLKASSIKIGFNTVSDEIQGVETDFIKYWDSTRRHMLEVNIYDLSNGALALIFSCVALKNELN